MTERESQLLSAYLDGECSPAELARAEELLARSEEARQVLQQLRQQQQLLRSLKPVPVPADMARQVVKRLRRRQRQRGERLRAERRRWWYRVAAAVALAFTAMLVAWLWREREVRPLGQERMLVQRQTEPTMPAEGGDWLAKYRGAELPGAISASREAARDFVLGAWQGFTQPAQELVASWNQVSRLASNWWQVASQELARLGVFSETDVLTSPMRLPALPLKRVELNLPLWFDGVAWDTKRLLAQLQAPRIHQLDLACPDVSGTYSRLLTALQQVPLSVTVDPDLQAQLQQKRLTGPVVIYLENLTPEQVGKLLTVWHAAEQAVAPESACLSLVLLPLERGALARWAQLFGVPPASLRLEERLPAGPWVDNSRPLSEDTLRHLRSLAEGGGFHVRHGEGPPVVAVSARPTQPYAKETRRVLDTRLGPRQGAITFLIILRPGKPG
jgi:HAMP domain-containing protein